MRGFSCAALVAALTASMLAAAHVARAAGETIRVEDSRTLTGNDPLDYSHASFQIVDLTCARLYRYPDLPGAAGYVTEPEVAAALPTVSADGLTVTIDLRHGFGFSPPSTEQVTAQSFVHAIERWQSPIGTGTGFDPTEVASATASADGYQLTLVLTRPVPNLVEQLSSQTFCAIPAHVPTASFDTDPTEPSAGPYYIAAASASPDEWVLKQNPNYAGDRLRNLGEIDWYLGVPVATAVADVEAGTADYAPAIGGADFNALDAQYGPGSAPAADGHQQFFSSPQPFTAFVDLNTSAGRPFADINLRQAVAYAIDRSAFAAATPSGLATPTDQILPPGFPGFQDWPIYPFTADSFDAMNAALLAGVYPAHPVTVTAYLRNGGSGGSSSATIESLLTAELQPLGINLDFQFENTANAYFSNLGTQGSNFDLAFFALVVVDDADPGDFLLPIFDGNTIRPTGNSDLSYFNDPSFNSRLEAAYALDPGAGRNTAFAQLDHDLSVAAPMVPVYNLDHPDLFSARIGCQIVQPLLGMDINDLCVRVASTEPAGGTISTGSSATTDAPIQTALTTPNAGPVSIQQGVATTTVTNYQLFQQQLTIVAPPATAAAPLQLSFVLDSSVVGSTDPSTIDVIRDGVPVPACADSSGQANPDPCLASRTTLAGGDLQLVVLSSHASLWNFGINLDRAPVCTAAAASPSTVWPPDGRLVPVAIGGVTDPDGDTVTTSITSVTQNEPLSGSADAVRTAGGLLVRADRRGNGSGRLYSIGFTAADGRGGSCSGTVQVVVPHDKGKPSSPAPGTIDSFGH